MYRRVPPSIGQATPSAPGRTIKTTQRQGTPLRAGSSSSSTHAAINTIISAAALFLVIGAVIPLSVILATTGKSSRRRDRRLQDEIDNLPPAVCNCSQAVNVTIPQSMFIAGSTADQNVTSGSGPNTVLFGSLSTKLLPLLPGMNLTTGVFTAPEDGLYLINWFVGFDSPEPGVPTSVIYGSLLVSSWVPDYININLPDTGFFTPYAGSMSAILAAGDTVAVSFINASTSLLTLNSGASLAITKVNTIP